jgi:cyclopropane-fatty-acyl-phospholipid synthase
MTLDIRRPDIPAPAAPVRPESLLSRAQSRLVEKTPSSPVPSTLARASRSAVVALLRRMTRDTLTVIESAETAGSSGSTTTTYGRADDLSATIEIRDPRAWVSLVREGSIGLGRGYVEGWWHSDNPVDVVRIIIRNIRPVDELRNRLGERTHVITDRVRRVLPRADRHRNREDISSHYDLGNDFFRLFLDSTMTYSSGIFPHPEATMEQASLTKYDTLIDSLGLTSDHHLLEIGTGWGGMAVRAAERTGCRVTTTTISRSQLEVATERVEAAGLGHRVTLLNSDWRDLDGEFDRVVSVEMIEAVDWRDYDHYFATIERCLTPEGRASLQAICVPDRRYERTKNTEDYIRRFIFPGGFLPSMGAIGRSVANATGLQLIGFNDFSAHYAETLWRWRAAFDSRLETIRDLGLDDRFTRLWRFYLAYCEAGFRERHCTVNHIHLAGSAWRDSLSTVPPVMI